MDSKKEFEFLLKQMNKLLKEHGPEIKKQVILAMPTVQEELMSIFSDLKENFEKYTASPERQRIFNVIIEVITEQLSIQKAVAMGVLDHLLNETQVEEGHQGQVSLIKSWLIQVKVRYERLPTKEYKATTTIFFDVKAPKKSTNITNVNRSDLPSEVREKFLRSGESELSMVIYQMGGE